MRNPISEKQQDALELKLINAFILQNRTCLFPGCTKSAINSHILQENGILNLIATEGRFMQQRRGTPFRPVEFHPAGVNTNEMFTFKGFCNAHDTSIFKEIESEMLDFENYKHQLLFSYRGLLNDLFKTQVLKDYFNKVIHHEDIADWRKEKFAYHRAKNLLRWKDLQHFKYLIETEVWCNAKTNRFRFYLFRLPFLEIATSTIYGSAFFPASMDLSYHSISKLNPISEEYRPVSNPIFINLIPQPDCFMFLLCHMTSLNVIEHIHVDEIAKFNHRQVYYLLSRILTRIETWGLSFKLFNDWKATGKIEQLMLVRNNWIQNRYQFVPSQNVVRNDDIPATFTLFD